jgi:hypothetical protein
MDHVCRPGRLSDAQPGGHIVSPEAVSAGLVCNPATCARRAWQTLGVRILVNFMHRDGWFIHCLAAEARTLISR